MTRPRNFLRRGANALEFALVAPVLVVMMGGTIDYGWYFWREALAVNALREGVRAGSLKTPDDDYEGEGDCEACIAQAEASATAALNAQGFYGFSLETTLERTPSTGTPCTYALVVTSDLPHTRVFSIVPGPSDIELRVISMAQNVECS